MIIFGIDPGVSGAISILKNKKVLDEISFTATDRAGEKISIDSDYIKKNIGELVKDADLSKFIL